MRLFWVRRLLFYKGFDQSWKIEMKDAGFPDTTKKNGRARSSKRHDSHRLQRDSSERFEATPRVPLRPAQAYGPKYGLEKQRSPIVADDHSAITALELWCG